MCISWGIENYIYYYVVVSLGNNMTLSQKYTEKKRKLKYPSEDVKRIQEIEDMAGKKNREEAVMEYKKDLSLKRQKYREEEYKIDQEFKQALFVEYGVQNHPKREKAFAMAWDRGHSSGYNDVELEFVDLAELMKD